MSRFCTHQQKIQTRNRKNTETIIDPFLHKRSYFLWYWFLKVVFFSPSPSPSIKKPTIHCVQAGASRNYWKRAGEKKKSIIPNRETHFKSDLSTLLDLGTCIFYCVLNEWGWTQACIYGVLYPPITLLKSFFSIEISQCSIPFILYIVVS